MSIQLKNSDWQGSFIKYHPRNFLFKEVDQKFHEARASFRKITKEFQEECNINRKYNQHGLKNCIIVIVNQMLLDANVFVHIRVLKGLAQDLKEATGLKVIFIDTNESNKDQGGKAKNEINELNDIFDESWSLDGDLALKWKTLHDIIDNSSCMLILTLGGMYESFLSPSIASLKNIKSLLYKTNDNAVPFNHFDKIYSFSGKDRRSLPLSDIKIAGDILKNISPTRHGKVQVVTAMRYMDTKIRKDSPFLNMLKAQINENTDIEWTLMGVKFNGEFESMLRNIERLKIIPMKELLAFSKDLFEYDIFYHAPEHPHGGVCTISMAYFLGLTVIVTSKNDVWGLIEEDDGCHTGDDMNKMLEIEISKKTQMSAEKRLESKIIKAGQRLTAFNKRRIEYLQELNLIIEKLVETGDTNSSTMLNNDEKIHVF